MEVDELNTSYNKSSEKAAAAISTLCREFVETEEERASVEEGREGRVAEKVMQRYRGHEGVLYHSGKRDIPEKAYPWVSRLRSEKISPFIRPTDIVLEYGVGSRWNLAELKCSWKIGYDVSEHLEEEVRSHGIDFIREIDEVEDGSVDVVLCHHVLEHTANPVEVLETMGRKLYPAGKLLLFVPFERGRRYLRYNREEPNHHLFSWNVQTLGNLLEECGFKVEEAGVGEYGYARFGGVWADRLRLGERGFRFIRRAVGFVKPLLEVRIIARKDFV